MGLQVQGMGTGQDKMCRCFSDYICPKLHRISDSMSTSEPGAWSSVSGRRRPSPDAGVLSCRAGCIPLRLRSSSTKPFLGQQARKLSKKDAMPSGLSVICHGKAVLFPALFSSANSICSHESAIGRNALTQSHTNTVIVAVIGGPGISLCTA